MRGVLIRCLVVLLSLALVSGGARASMPMVMGTGEAEHHCHDEHAAIAGETTHEHPDAASHHSGRNQDDQQKSDRACCCDGMACVSAISLTPPLAMAPMLFFAAIQYGEW